MKMRQKELKKILRQCETGINQAVERLSGKRIKIAQGIAERILESHSQIKQIAESLLIRKKLDIRIEVKKLLQERCKNVVDFSNAINGMSVSGAKTIARWLRKTDDRLAELLIAD